MKLKLCGFREPLSLAKALSYHPDYLGLIFYKGSPRYITPDNARALIETVTETATQRHTPNKPQFIGVFVDEPLDDLVHTIERVGLAGVQLHGSESPSFIKTLREQQNHLIIWKAFRIKNHTTFTLATQRYGKLLEMPHILNALLLDGFTPNVYGGGGKQIDFTLLKAWMTLKQNIILAGGIGSADLPTFMQKAVYGLDVSSSLEENYIKMPHKITAFMNAFNKYNA